MTNRVNVSEIIFFIFALIFCIVIAVWDWNVVDTGPWYIGCVDTVSGQQYLLKADQRPVLRDGFIIIGKETFITPRPMMTCRIVSEEELTSNGDGAML